MKNNKKKIIIFIIILVISIGVILTFLIKNPFYQREISKEEEITEDIIGDSKEDILKYLDKKYADKNTEILFLEETETNWIFLKQTKKDKTRIEMYVVRKDDKQITINAIYSQKSSGM